MSPYAAGTLGWVSVHGQAYATAAILWVLLDVVRYSKKPDVLSNRLLVRHAFLLLVAATSFGTGLASTVVFVLVVVLWDPVPTQRNRLIAVYGSLAVAAIALYVSTMAFQGGDTDNLSKILRLGTNGISIAIARTGEKHRSSKHLYFQQTIQGICLGVYSATFPRPCGAVCYELSQ